MAVHPFPWPASLAPPSSPTNSPQPPSLNQTLLPTHGSQLFPPRLLNHCPVQTTTTHLGFHWFLYFHPTHVTSETILHAAYQPPVALQIETNILTCLRGLHGLTPTYLSSPTHSFPLLSVPNPTAHFLIFRVTKFLLPQGLCTCCSHCLPCSSIRWAQVSLCLHSGLCSEVTVSERPSLHTLSKTVPPSLSCIPLYLICSTYCHLPLYSFLFFQHLHYAFDEPGMLLKHY